MVALFQLIKASDDPLIAPDIQLSPTVETNNQIRYTFMYPFRNLWSKLDLGLTSIEEKKKKFFPKKMAKAVINQLVCVVRQSIWTLTKLLHQNIEDFVDQYCRPQDVQTFLPHFAPPNSHNRLPTSLRLFFIFSIVSVRLDIDRHVGHVSAHLSHHIIS